MATATVVSIDAFRKRTFESFPLGCWVWSGTCNPYARVSIGNRSVALHRLMFMLHHNLRSIPKGKVVMHLCDNKRCIYPDHLKLGNQRDNVHDMVQKGRQSKGSRRPAAKLTEARVRRIRGFAAKGWSQARIAAFFKVSQPCIGFVLRRETWKHVD